MTGQAPPRIYCIPAGQAPVVAVLRRGPRSWSHVGRWDLAENSYTSGAWLKGRIFPRRCDLSPDGRLLCYFAFKPNASWKLGTAYVAISRLPWLVALHAFSTCGTWSRGFHFSDDRSSKCSGIEDPPIPYSLRLTSAVQFATERRRGWCEAPDCPPRADGDTWDQRRNVRLLKPQPHGERVLRVESLGWAGGEFGSGQAVDGLRVRYRLESDGDHQVLDELQWADWDREGRLLVATRSGMLQIRNLSSNDTEIAFEEDLSCLMPQTSPAPPWARKW